MSKLVPPTSAVTTSDRSSDPCQLGTPFCAGHRPGHDRLEGPPLGLAERHRAAARAGHEQGAAEARVAEAVLEAPQVARHPTAHVRVDDGRRRPLVLAVLAGDLVRDGDIAREAGVAERALGGKLVLGVRVRVHECNRDRGHAFGREDLGCPSDVVCLDGDVHLATGPDPLRDREPEPARDERRRGAPEQVVGLVPVAAAGLEDVAEPLRAEEPDGCAGTREERVQAHRRAVQEVAGAVELATAERLLDRGDDTELRRSRRRRLLVDTYLAGLVVVVDEVRERAADVHADARRHDPPRTCPRESRMERRNGANVPVAVQAGLTTTSRPCSLCLPACSSTSRDERPNGDASPPGVKS